MNFVSFKELLEDSKSLIRKLPRKDITGVIGIPKSGMIPATIMACELRVPLASLGGKFWDGNPTSGTILLIDDSLASGEEMAKSVKAVSLPEGCKVIRAAVYASNLARRHPEVLDYYHKIITRPRYFEWNMWGHPKISRSVLDMDGVLCVDPAVRDDDGPEYQNALINAIPLHIPSRAVIGIATGRLERWRGITEEWLSKHGIRYGTLHMSPHPTAYARRKARDVPSMKAKAYAASNAMMFIESETKQARRICWESKRPVLATDTMTVYQQPADPNVPPVALPLDDSDG